ncbi:MAG: OstA-like protein [Ignavibacteriaceae bacterium]
MKNILIILIFTYAMAYPQEELITVTGDSLIGHMSAGESIREVYGNVVLTQGNVVITCNQAVQFISRNDAELIGNVVVKQDSLTITTSRGFYYGDERRAESANGVHLNDQKVILTAKTGEYYFNEDRAFFRDSVNLYDTTTTLTSDSLTYFKNENRVVAVNNVKIVDSSNVIEADSLQHFRDTRITFADDNVKITSLENNVMIFGDHLEDYAQRYYTLINENPLLMQIDTTYADTVRYDTLGNAIDTVRTSELDTLIIKSLKMEAYRDSVNIFKAADSVRIVRAEFASKNDFTVYYRDEEKIITEKVTAESVQPVLWFENSQLTGDSVTIFLRDNRIQLLEMDNNAFILSQSEIFRSRYDQISGERIKIIFDDDGINSTEVEGTVYSIYYLYEEEEPNGLIKATSQSAIIKLSEKKVSEVRLYGSPKSEYYPENQVEGEEETFTLPGYRISPGRPVKEDLLNGKPGSGNLQDTSVIETYNNK